ncbi:hypothetical protein [Archangium lipolyticum]|uniref:hypothetical protein n=1 Tax=Archangium lipolyticum TaxID=2970465 RepID=UPI00214B60A6|nr:hypothetical protein [Archangium lipolyticum]
MNPRTRHVQSVLLALMFALSACGSTVDTQYPGEPLLTLEGQMTLAPGTTVNGPVRIALVWYPRWLLGVFFLPGSVPETSAVVAEDYPYEGSFPANFRFHIYRPPGSAHWVTADGSVRELATGLLLAYQDVNGNGKLDTIPATGKPVDRVLGSSLVFGASRYHTLLYTDREMTLMPGMEAKKGFNLLKLEGYESAVLPLSSTIPLELSVGGPHLDVLVCQGMWDGNDSQVEGDLCGIPGLGEDPDADPPAVDLMVDVRVKRAGNRAQVHVTVERGGTYTSVKDAQVLLGNQFLTYNSSTSSYELLDADAAPLLEGGRMELGIAQGKKVYRRWVTIPGRVELTTPAPGTHVKLNSPFELRWTRPFSVDGYTIYVKTVEGDESQGWDVLSNRQSHTVTLYDQYVSTGPALIEFSASATPLLFAPYMWVQVKAVLEVPITIDP